MVRRERSWKAALDKPGVFAFVALAVYLMVMTIPLSASGWDVSHFIVAGDRFVDKAAVPDPIYVRDHSDGYDGQFYYRLAIHPDARKKTADGVTFDAPAWRMQRIVYPVFAHMVSIGIPAFVPYALFLINLLGVLLIAYMTRRIQRRFDFPGWLPWAVMVWPGYVVTLVHDTTEILALALLISAMGAYLARRTALYVLLAALTSLTRETSIVIFGGIFLYEAWRWAKHPHRTAFGHMIAVGAAMIPFLVWRQFLIARWDISPQAEGGGNIGFPFAGVGQTLWYCLSGTRQWAIKPFTNALDRVVIGISICVIIGSSIWAASTLPRIIRSGDRSAGLAMGWAILAGTMSLLGADGPWIDTTAYFRAFSEFWLMTMLVLAVSRVRMSWIAAIPAFLVWGVCIGITT